MDNFREKVEGLVREISSGVSMISIYGVDHPKAQGASENIFNLLKGLFLERSEIAIGIFSGEVIFEDAVFFSLSIQLKKFILDLSGKGVEKITFRPGVSREEIGKFINIISTGKSSGPAASVDASLGMADLLLAAGVRNIGINKLYTPGAGAASAVSTPAARVLPQNAYQASTSRAKDIFIQALSKELDFISTSSLIEHLKGQMDKNRELLTFSLSIKEHDDYTFVHSVNVSLMVMMQARSLGIDEAAIYDFGLAAFLHDIGKLGVSGELLRKPAGLTPQEFEEVRKHPSCGAKIIFKSKGVSAKLPMIVAFEHHLRYDLKGYPKINYATRPHLASQLTSIADFYDSLRSTRAYRQDYPPERVYDMMQEDSGKAFDPLLLNNFFKLIGKWPPGTVVRLLDKREAVVLENNSADIFSPVVFVSHGANGEKLKEGIVLDLAKQDSTKESRIFIESSIYIEEKDIARYMPEGIVNGI